MVLMVTCLLLSLLHTQVDIATGMAIEGMCYARVREATGTQAYFTQRFLIHIAITFIAIT